MTQKRQRQLKRARLRYWCRRSSEFVSQGLTTRGSPRKYKLHAELDCWHGWRRKAEYQHLVRSILRAKGLTVRGTQPKPQRHFAELAGLHGRPRRRLYFRLITRDLASRGLTARGTPRKNNWLNAPKSHVEIAWRQLRKDLGELSIPDFVPPLERGNT